MKEMIINYLREFFNVIQSQIPVNYRIFLVIFLYTVLIAIYAILIWKFYRFLAKRDVIKLNLNKYNTSEHVFLKKSFSALLFLVEYIIIIPILIFFWFFVLGFFLLMLSKSQGVEQILLISAAIIGAVRITSYFSEDLSKDLAKMFPFTILAIFLLDPNFFSLNLLLDRVSEIPLYVDKILFYFIFIVAIEIILRFLFVLIDLVVGTKEENQVN